MTTYKEWATLPAGTHIDLPDDHIEITEEVTLYVQVDGQSWDEWLGGPHSTVPDSSEDRNERAEGAARKDRDG